jgi:hypothetical protein
VAEAEAHYSVGAAEVAAPRFAAVGEGAAALRKSAAGEAGAGEPLRLFSVAAVAGRVASAHPGGQAVPAVWARRGGRGRPWRSPLRRLPVGAGRR